MEGRPILDNFERKNSPHPNAEVFAKFKSALERDGASIIEGPYPSRDTTIDVRRYQDFPADVLEVMGKNAVYANTYLQGYVVLDPFGDGLGDDVWEKRGWRTKLVVDFPEVAPDVLETNRIRGNRFTAIFGQSDRLLRKMDRAQLSSPAAEEVREVLKAIVALGEPFETFGDRYKHATLAERTRITLGVSAAADRYLKLVTVPAEDALQEEPA